MTHEFLQATRVQGRAQRHRRLLQGPLRSALQELERAAPSTNRRGGGGCSVVGGDAWGQPRLRAQGTVNSCQLQIFLNMRIIRCL
jgi:hypothetical protein